MSDRESENADESEDSEDLGQPLAHDGSTYAEMPESSPSTQVPDMDNADPHATIAPLQADESVRGTRLDEVRLQSGMIPNAIGPYRILRVIGEGGMGTVFLAEQTQPIRRQVALKLIKSGHGSLDVIRRFEAERQALAMMDHQNIAKILDAGTAQDGSPYFAMEYVEGIPLTQYCDQQELSVQQRLELLIPVCNAVQHAHQKGIIHRDLKPSNVLVTVYDGDPVPKVIDFGLAKALDRQNRISDETISAHGMVMGTLQYMSPEQAEMDPGDIDTRTDIFALGVILYELLTGSTPIAQETLARHATLRILEMIREYEPPKPSRRLSDRSENLKRVSEQRRIEPKRLSTILRGELDWIVMKSLEKDRNRRYETANAFARDIQRYLQHEPIEARPPSFLYRLQKSFRRNRVKFLTAATFLSVLIIALPVITWQAIRNQNLAQAREQEITNQRLTAEFLLDVFGAGDPIFSKLVSRFGSDFGQEPTVKDVVIGALRIEIDDQQTELGDRPLLRGKLLAMLGDIAISTGEVALGREALNKCEQLTAGTDFSKEAEYYKAQVSQALLDYMYGDMLSAKQRLLTAQQVLLPMSRANPSDVALERKAADTYLILGIVLVELYDHDGAIAAFKEMAALSQGDQPVHEIRRWAGEVFAETTAADKRRIEGVPIDVAKMIDEFQTFMKLINEKQLIDKTVMVAVENALNAQLMLGAKNGLLRDNPFMSRLVMQPQEAMLKNMQQALGEDHLLNCFPLFFASNLADQADDTEEAIRYVDELLELVKTKLPGCRHPRLCQVHTHRAKLLLELWKKDQQADYLRSAELSCTQALEIGLPFFEANHWQPARAFLKRAQVRLLLGNRTGAEQDLEEVYMRLSDPKATGYMRLNTRRELAEMFQLLGRLKRAEEEIRKVIELRIAAQNRRDQLGRDRMTLVGILRASSTPTDQPKSSVRSRSTAVRELLELAVEDLNTNPIQWSNTLTRAKEQLAKLRASAASP